MLKEGQVTEFIDGIEEVMEWTSRVNPAFLKLLRERARAAFSRGGRLGADACQTVNEIFAGYPDLVDSFRFHYVNYLQH